MIVSSNPLLQPWQMEVQNLRTQAESLSRERDEWCSRFKEASASFSERCDQLHALQAGVVEAVDVLGDIHKCGHCLACAILAKRTLDKLRALAPDNEGNNPKSDGPIVGGDDTYKMHLMETGGGEPRLVHETELPDYPMDGASPKQ